MDRDNQTELRNSIQRDLEMDIFVTIHQSKINKKCRTLTKWIRAGRPINKENNPILGGFNE